MEVHGTIYKVLRPWEYNLNLMEPLALVTNLQNTQGNQNHARLSNCSNQQNQTVSSPKIEMEDGRGSYRLRDTLTIDKPVSIIMMMMMKELEECGPWIVKNYYQIGTAIWGEKEIMQVTYWDNNTSYCVLSITRDTRYQDLISFPQQPRRWQSCFSARPQRHQGLFPGPFGCSATKKRAHLWCILNSPAVTAKHRLLLKCIITMATFGTRGRFSQRRFVG